VTTEAENLEPEPAADRAETPQTPETPPPAASDTDDYFTLSAPMNAGKQTLTRLLINPKRLGGKGFFGVVNQFQKRFPDIYRTSFNLYSEIHFLALVIAKLNRITPEDLYKLEYTDLPLLMLRASAFHYSGGAPTPEETETGEAQEKAE
jgi:hypothetical protein